MFVQIFISAKLIFHITVQKRICVTGLEIESPKLITLSTYRLPTEDINQLIKNIDDALKHLYKLKAELLICRDINTGYLIESNRKNN